jgi:predicted transcriptional regulator
LTGSGLINKIEYDKKSAFVITEKGRLFLEEYKRFSDLAGSFGLEL